MGSHFLYHKRFLASLALSSLHSQWSSHTFYEVSYRTYAKWKQRRNHRRKIGIRRANVFPIICCPLCHALKSQIVLRCTKGWTFLLWACHVPNPAPAPPSQNILLHPSTLELERDTSFEHYCRPDPPQNTSIRITRKWSTFAICLDSLPAINFFDFGLGAAGTLFFSAATEVTNTTPHGTKRKHYSYVVGTSKQLADSAQ